MSKRIAISELQPGMVIVSITEQNGPVRIRKSGLVTSDAMVTGLREMGVLELEIDPAQTVELDAAPAAVTSGASASSSSSTSSPSASLSNAQNTSQTQFLLQSNVSQHSGTSSSEQDSQLAEQFNRSLFLPTAQDIPDAWQIYSKKAAAGLAIVLVGFGLGFGGALFNAGALFNDTHGADNATSIANNASNSDASKAESSKAAGQPGSAKADGQEAGALEAGALETGGEGSSELPEAALAKTSEESLAKAADTLAAISDIEAPEKELLVLGVQPGNTVKLLDENGQQVNGTLVTGNGVEGQTLTAADNPQSQALLEKLQKAMQEVDAQSESDDGTQQYLAQSPDSNVPSVSQMPSWVLSSLPKMSFNTHIYATEPADRWVKVNGKELGEGDWIDGQLRVERIEPQHVILNFQGHEFSMRALSEW